MMHSNATACVAASPLPLTTAVSRRGFEWFARAVLRAYCPLRVTGRHHLPPMPFIACSNHASHLDPIALMTATGHPFGSFGMIAASDYFFRNPLVHRVFSSMVHLIPIDRTAGAASLAQTLSLCREFLQPGQRSLILFPEGTRSATGEMGRFKRGIALISCELGVPIVPAYIDGSGRAMPRGRPFPAPGRVAVHIGEPLFPDASRPHGATARALERTIRTLQERSRER